jgi:hypothetical protein
MPTGGLALGVYCMLLGIAFYVPFMLSPLAQQNDVFMTNLFLGLGALFLGSALLAIEASSMSSLKPWMSFLLGIGAAALAFLGIAGMLTTSAYGSVAPIMAAYTAVLLALSMVAAARCGHLMAWARALLVALVAAGLVALYYALLGGQYHDAFGVATYLPRYLDGWTSALAVLLGIAVFVVGRVWARRA